MFKNFCKRLAAAVGGLAMVGVAGLCLLATFACVASVVGMLAAPIGAELTNGAALVAGDCFKYAFYGDEPKQDKGLDYVALRSR